MVGGSNRNRRENGFSNVIVTPVSNSSLLSPSSPLSPLSRSSYLSASVSESGSASSAHGETLWKGGGGKQKSHKKDWGASDRDRANNCNGDAEKGPQRRRRRRRRRRRGDPPQEGDRHAATLTSPWPSPSPPPRNGASSPVPRAQGGGGSEKVSSETGRSGAQDDIAVRKYKVSTKVSTKSLLSPRARAKRRKAATMGRDFDMAKARELNAKGKDAVRSPLGVGSPRVGRDVSLSPSLSISAASASGVPTTAASASSKGGGSGALKTPQQATTVVSTKSKKGRRKGKSRSSRGSPRTGGGSAMRRSPSIINTPKKKAAKRKKGTHRRGISFADDHNRPLTDVKLVDMTMYSAPPSLVAKSCCVLQ